MVVVGRQRQAAAGRARDQPRRPCIRAVPNSSTTNRIKRSTSKTTEPRQHRATVHRKCRNGAKLRTQAHRASFFLTSPRRPGTRHAQGLTIRSSKGCVEVWERRGRKPLSADVAAVFTHFRNAMARMDLRRSAVPVVGRGQSLRRNGWINTSRPDRPDIRLFVGELSANFTLQSSDRGCQKLTLLGIG